MCGLPLPPVSIQTPFSPQPAGGGGGGGATRSLRTAPFFISEWVRGMRGGGGEGLPSAAGPWLLQGGGKERGEQGQTKPAGPAVCANSGLGQGSGPPVVSLNQREHGC